MKKKYIGIFGAVAAVSVLSIVIGVTIAYLGDNKTKENTVTVGHGDVSIDENFDEPSEMSMENDITKKVQVQNTGTVPAFVRVYAEFSDSELAKHAKVKYSDTEYSWNDFKTKLDFQNPTLTSSKWRYVPEIDANGALGGYFYYTEKLNESDTTPQLFDSVTIDYQKYNGDALDTTDSNIDRIQPLEMIVYSELIQTVETGSSTVTEDEQTKTVYGYDYGEHNEWRNAWKSFLRVTP